MDKKNPEPKSAEVFNNILSWGNVMPSEYPNEKVPMVAQPYNRLGVGPGILGKVCGRGKCGPGPIMPMIRLEGI